MTDFSPTGFVYTSVVATDDHQRGDDDPYPILANNSIIPVSALPREGEFFIDPVHGLWWKVERIAWSSIPDIGTGAVVVAQHRGYDGWADIVASPVEGDPRDPDWKAP